MIGRLVGIAAICALGANAFLLPPGIADVPSTSEYRPGLHEVVSLPCSECAFPTPSTDLQELEDGKDFLWIAGGANSLVLNFSVTDDGKSVRLNGAPFFPMAYETLGDDGDFTVEQVPSNTDMAQVDSANVRSTTLRVTEYGLTAATEAQEGSETPDAFALYSVIFKTLAVEGVPIHVDDVEVQILRTEDYQLYIMEVIHHRNLEIGHAMEPPPPPPPADLGEIGIPPPPPPHPIWFRPHHHQECSVLPKPLCELKNMLDNKIDHAMRPDRHGRHDRPCPGRQGHGPHLPGHIKPHFVGPHRDGSAKSPLGRPHHMRPHGGPHGHHGPHGFHGHHGHHGHHILRTFAKGLVAVLIPVIAGIAVGMTVSLFGLLVGRLISLLWISLVRGGRRGRVSDEVVMEDGEDKAMLDEMDAPPVYEQAPAYESLERDEKEQL